MSFDIRPLVPKKGGVLVFDRLDSLFQRSAGLSKEKVLYELQNDIKPQFPPLDNLPCGNVQVEKYTACKNDGKFPCSACRLVSYCSRDCQKHHWKVHKHDCKSYIRSNDWKPAWVSQNRFPTCVPDTDISGSTGAALWGNIPAMDIINLRNNESDSNKDFALAFAASGDLRHVVRTVNALDPAYSGSLKILLNDLCPPIVVRNLTLLLTLGTIPDEALAADMALHLWYSVFMPLEYQLGLSAMLTSTVLGLKHDQPLVASLGSCSSLTCMMEQEVIELLRANVSASMTMDQAQNEYHRVRHDPSREDFHDRIYAGLKPSHRRAFLEFRRFGIVLPFGAMNAHFNAPNVSLFTPTGKWFQTDFADPLEGWDLDAVFNAGKVHGAQPEDVYGCLYFMLSDELMEFAHRIRSMKLSFHLFSVHACTLPELITSGSLSAHGIQPSDRFDRIDVSNILDSNYVGIEGVLNSWGRMLAQSDTAAIVGYFMNWSLSQPGGRVQSANEEVFGKIVQQMVKDGKVPGLGPNQATPLDLAGISTSTFLGVKGMDALYDNSQAFRKFLKNQGLDRALRASKLKLRNEHRIMPRRLRVPLDGKLEDLPHFPDEETWYRYVRLSCVTWCERFVEFSHD